jgi:hypothetical protein
LMWIPGSEATDVTLSGFGSDVCASWWDDRTHAQNRPQEIKSFVEVW